MAGIAFSYFCGNCMPLYLSLLVVGSSVMLLSLLWQRLPAYAFGVALMLSLFSLGATVATLDKDSDSQNWSGEKGCFEALLLETPHVAGKATRVTAEVTRVGRDSVARARRNGRVYLYFANNVSLESLSAGDKLLFEGRVEPPSNAGNPAEFDVAHYMFVNGITGTAYLAEQQWRLSGPADDTFTTTVRRWRDKIVEIYASMGFGKDVASVLSALTVGEKRDLSQEIRDVYAAVGASHVLALSGLHLGILYMVLSLLLPLLVQSRVLRGVRELLILSFLWLFVAMAGFTPSVVRAALLFSLMSVARLIRRDGSSLNSLALAAVVMLIVSPRLLHDIGFQLSFSAVFAILLLSDTISRLLRADKYGPAYKYFASLIAVSFAAQIGTLPFVWYYFGTFPLYFLLTNIVVVPAAFLIMLLAVVLLLSTPLAIVQHFVAWILDALISCVNFLLRGIESLPCSSLQLPDIDAATAFSVGAILLICLYALMNRHRVAAVAAMLSAFAVVGYNVYVLWADEYDAPYIIFFNSRSCPAMQAVVSKEQSYMFTTYPANDADYDRVAAPYWKKRRMAQPKPVMECCYNDYGDASIVNDNGLVQFYGRRIKVLADEHWVNDSIIEPVDCIYLCRGFLGSIKDLLLIYPTRNIVLDATLYKNSRVRILRESAQAGVNTVDLSQRGAVMLPCRIGGTQFVDMRGKY